MIGLVLYLLRKSLRICRHNLEMIAVIGCFLFVNIDKFGFIGFVLCSILIHACRVIAVFS